MKFRYWFGVRPLQLYLSVLVIVLGFCGLAGKLATGDFTAGIFDALALMLAQWLAALVLYGMFTK